MAGHGRLQSCVILRPGTEKTVAERTRRLTAGGVAYVRSAWRRRGPAMSPIQRQYIGGACRSPIRVPAPHGGAQVLIEGGASTCAVKRPANAAPRPVTFVVTPSAIRRPRHVGTWQVR